MSKTYIKPGDIVRVNKEIQNRPLMIVEQIEKSKQATGNTETTTGIRCFWFDTKLALNKAKFNFKDLEVC